MHGDLRLVGYRAEFLDATGKVLLRRDRQPLRSSLPRLDALYLSAAPQPGAARPLELLVEAGCGAARRPRSQPTRRCGSTLERTSDLPATWLSFSEYLELAAASREAILGAGARRAPMCPWTAEPPAAGRDRCGRAWRPRGRGGRGALAAARAAVADAGRADVLRARLADFAFFGVVEGIPGRLVADGQLDATLAETDRRPRRRDRRDRSGGSAARGVRRGFPGAAAGAAGEPGELNNSFRRSDELQGGDPLQALSWLQGVSRVRAGPRGSDALLMYAAALGSCARFGAEGRAAAVRRG